MATAKQPVIQQTVDLPGSGRLVYKSDKKWYYQTVTGGVVVSESQISSAEANKLKGTPAQRGAVSPGGGQPSRAVERPTSATAQKEIATLEKLQPNADGLYIYKGQELTRTQYQNELDRLRGILGEREVAGGQAQRTQQQTVQAERDRLVQYIADFTQQLNFAQSIVDNSTDTEAVKRATAWVNKLSADQKKLTGFLKTIDDTGKLPTAYVLPEIPTPQQIQGSSPGGAAPTGGGRFGERIQEARAGVAAPVTTPGAGPVPVSQREQQPGVSRMPSITLEQINAARTQQNLPLLELVDGKYREVVSKKEVSAADVAASTGAATTTPATVGAGGTGGATVGGTTPGAVPPAAAGPAAPVLPAAWEQAAREQFGAYYEVIKNDPEIMKLIEDDITLGLSDQQYQARLEQTRWWRTTTASARAWEEDKARDPATLQTRIDNQLAALRDTSLRLGLRLNEDSLARLAEDSLRFGWSNNVIQNAIGSEALRSAGGVSDLRRGYIGQTIRNTAGSYGLPLSDVTFNEWVGKIATGQENEASFQAYALDLAKNLYPSLAASLDKGVSFRAITDPYRQAASRILEINPETVDFADPKWAQAFTARGDKGEQMMMTYGEWNDYLRTNPTFGYEYTDGAKERAYTVVNRLAELFGAA